MKKCIILGLCVLFVSLIGCEKIDRLTNPVNTGIDSMYLGIKLDLTSYEYGNGGMLGNIMPSAATVGNIFTTTTTPTISFVFYCTPKSEILSDGGLKVVNNKTGDIFFSYTKNEIQQLSNTEYKIDTGGGHYTMLEIQSMTKVTATMYNPNGSISDVFIFGN